MITRRRVCPPDPDAAGRPSLRAQNPYRLTPGGAGVVWPGRMASREEASFAMCAGAFRADVSIDHMLTETARAGFDGVEMVMRADGPVSFDTSEAACCDIAKRARKAGLAISGLAIDPACTPPFVSTDPECREAAVAQVIAAMDRAVWLGTDVSVLGPGVVVGSCAEATSYEEAYGRWLNALLVLRFEAERRAVCLGLRVPAAGFLLSPLETREFIDHCNSHWIQVCLDVGALSAIGGSPRDWARCLGRRVLGVYVDHRDIGGEHQAGARDGFGLPHDWRSMFEVLREIGYAGPLTYLTDSDDTEVARMDLKRLRMDLGA